MGFWDTLSDEQLDDFLLEARVADVLIGTEESEF